MVEPAIPTHLVEARRTPLFDPGSLPAALVRSHRTTVWAVLRVQAGASVRRPGRGVASRRSSRSGEAAVIGPGVEHRIEPSTDAGFFVQFYREPAADRIPSGRRRRGLPAIRSLAASRT